MTASPRASTAFAQPQAWNGPVLAAAVVFLLVYGVELSHFTLSKDEEVASFATDTALTWLSQGRWGMSLLTWLLPNFEAIPLLSTALFGTGLIFAASRAIDDFRLSTPRAYVYAIVHTGFPLWLHIAEFNTFAAGFGFGLAAAALGGGLAVRSRTWRDRIAAIALLAFAVSIYQTLAIYIVLYILLTVHAEFEADPDGSASARTRELVGKTLVSAGVFVGAFIACWMVQRIALRVTGIQMAYVDMYLQWDRLRADPAGSLTVAAQALSAYLCGTHPIYLGWGAAVLALSWLGLLPLWRLLRGGGGNGLQQWTSTWLVAILGVALVAAPFVLSVGTLPARAHIAWPLLAAWLATRSVPIAIPRLPTAYALVLAYYSVVVASIGSSLFYTEQLARAADAALTQRLAPAIVEAAGAGTNGTIPFALSGQFYLPVDGQMKRAEVFGTSFYEHDGGNVRRVALYMKLQGFNGLDPVWLGNRPDLIPAAQSMPTWPAPGSVRRVNGVVIVKLGPPTPRQLVKS
ncbi:glucosyltransferase domain-containing protein [Lysobacter sp. 5GHs7-4]|uniref:glucosyltransferase domain-containing protein n=1 Tax=Lysobacter sp. 5GHs7-4 TaxID=2904253 RepID=UPI001E59077B|nr:glucosyltransferase domain-containing protein [Lysobacter sp. 5GHs7-4]UHQ22668.1 glucosyltransferase domain-containing protein [Lysobacter sp. 5GHs7-4]